MLEGKELIAVRYPPYSSKNETGIAGTDLFAISTPNSLVNTEKQKALNTTSPYLFTWNKPPSKKNPRPASISR